MRALGRVRQLQQLQWIEIRFWLLRQDLLRVEGSY